jgi:hypothetical protein
MKKLAFFLGMVSLVLMNSCLGAEVEISMHADGSGKIALEYRVSQMLESLGRLDGNERWPSVPVGKADFERTVARIPGLRLLSFSSKEAPSANKILGGKDLVTKVSLEFKNAAALLAFWGSGVAGSGEAAGSGVGSGASLIRRDGKNVLRLVLMDPLSATIDGVASIDGAPLVNGDLLSLLKEISTGYELSLSLSTPQNAALSFSPSSVTAARIVSQGKKVSFAIDMGDLLELKDGLAVEISW